MSRSGARSVFDRVFVLLDHFKVEGVSGEHDALVFQATGPHLGVMFDDKPTVIQQAIKSLIRSSCAWSLAQREHYLRDLDGKCDDDLRLAVSRTGDSSGRTASDRFLPRVPSSSRESARVRETRGHGHKDNQYGRRFVIVV